MYKNRRADRLFALFLVVAVLGVLSSGCGSSEAKYRRNRVYAMAQQASLGGDSLLPEDRLQDIDDVLTAMFGTPDEPALPVLADADVSEMLSLDKLKMAAGPVWSEQDGAPHGLYREHCAHCHGLTGDGAGPTSEFLNPYPRDYRMGVFKFKSTPKGARPTHDDLRRVIVNGIPGTAMPSFKLLPEGEIEALIQYVEYLSMRGESERALIYECLVELEEGQPLIRFDSAGGNSSEFLEDLQAVQSLVTDVVNPWIEADSKAVSVASAPDDIDMEASIDRGRKLFYGNVANCVKCHGNSALGDGQTTDFDDWTKDWSKVVHATNPLDPDPKVSAELQKYIKAGAFMPRNIRPRNLRLGVYRGGRRPVDLFWRITNGIDGTPMPGLQLRAEDSGGATTGLTHSEVWDLVNYVRSLPYEEISETGALQPALQRDRL